MSNDEVRPGRLPGCESANHEICYGELWQCSQCGKTVCAAEGSEDDPELCDDCWMAKHYPEQDTRINDLVRPGIKPTVAVPDLDTLAYWLWDGVAEATDGCVVELDGTCPHGHRSWLRELGLI